MTSTVRNLFSITCQLTGFYLAHLAPSSSLAPDEPPLIAETDPPVVDPEREEESVIVTPASVAGTECVLVIVDTETTGVYNEDKIVQLAARTVYADGSGADDFFDKLIHPGAPGLVRLEAALRDGSPCKVTGAMLVGAQSFKDVGKQFLEFLQRTAAQRIVFVAHNAPFDKRMLDNAFNGSRLPSNLVNIYRNAAWICSGMLARRIRKQQGKGKEWALDKVCISFVPMCASLH